MSENTQGKFVIHKVYVKDLSFETPSTPGIFTETNWQPDVNIQLASQGNALDASHMEVVLTLTVTAKLQDRVAYLAEVQQAGIFQLEGFAADQMAHLQGAFCPNVLFPYAREVVSDLVVRGGFPPLYLAPVNFDALFAQHMQQQQAAGTH